MRSELTIEEDDPNVAHPYICEWCLAEVPLTLIEFWRVSDHRGSFHCPACREKLARRKKALARRRSRG